MLIKRVLNNRLFSLFSIVPVPIHTLMFGTIKSPVDFTLSKIGSSLDYRAQFIFWGILTGLLLTLYVLYTFKKAGYNNKTSKILLILSYICLVLTVLSPARRELMDIWLYMHFIMCAFFVSFLLLTFYKFLRHLNIHHRATYRQSIFFFILAIILPLTLLIAYGKLTGIAEIVFILLISLFLIVVNVGLHKNQESANALLC